MRKMLQDTRDRNCQPPAACAASAAEGQKAAKAISFSFEGPFGTFDKGQLQRGYKVYKEVCSSCHSMKLVSFRNLKANLAGRDSAPRRSKHWPRHLP